MRKNQLLLMLLVSFFTFLNFVSSSALPSAQNDESVQVRTSSVYDYFRLPRAIKPELYRLEIITHLNDKEGFEFNGKVYIDLNIVEDTNNITLHSSNLTIDQNLVRITRKSSSDIENEEMNNESNSNKIDIKSIDINLSHDFYIIHLTETLKKDEKYQLLMPFKANLSKNLYGYYRSSYFDHKTNQRVWLSTTQFEPTHARTAFPCFDEPDMKAKFKILLAHDKKYTAISNMPLQNQKEMTDIKGWVWDEFEESVPMSTYLVAYTINDFGYKDSPMEKLVENNDKHGNVTFRTWARKNALDQAEYAAEIGPKILRYYEEYFDIKFPLPKMDEIAIPDFSAGAMENWGLITYRETALLYSKNQSTLSNKYRVASVIAHELAHQWFGNLVTMKWWTDLWLNEGFATYIASLGVEYVHPEWNSLKEESSSNIFDIFRVDALKTSHPISTEIKEAHKISQIFDAISYSKGSCAIRMMHLFLGEETFKKGVSNYLKKFQYKNAQQDDLWESLTEIGHNLKTLPIEQNIKRIMDSWTLQAGYPIVKVVRDYKTGGAYITQSRYLLDTYASRDNLGNCWYVPLSYTTESEGDFDITHPQEWLTCNEETKDVIPLTKDFIANPNEWVIFNIQVSGLYKVKYDEKNWNMIIETLMSDNYKKIHLINRAQLIDDALDLAWTGEQDYNIAMRIIEYLRREKEYIPWKIALDNLNLVNRIMKKTSEYENFKLYIKKVLEPIYEHLEGMNTSAIRSTDDNDLERQRHKVLIAGWSCKFEVGDCIPRAKEYFREWFIQENPDEYNPIPLELRSVVYCTAVRHGNENEWNFLWKRYKKSNVASEKTSILVSLGCSREVWVLQRYLDWSFNETTGIRKQDVSTVFGAIARSDIGYHLAKEFLFLNFEKIYKYFAPETSRLSRFIRPIANQMSTDTELELMKSFTSRNRAYLEKSSEGVKRALEIIEINAQWKTRNFGEINNELKKLVGPDDH
ncbi:aminopeptidase N-like [Condylostylus longicornis]|uniref:aminopeptidase N-like n=1 Tax=Condylostylus longicornis TaxID=2530218 RepID=UPI00244DFE7B|nr:aminopeptidase N-like [Condylostylus longicornis]XP_055379137.1 aminopeptidase N-like [Condylostylus longicornis]